MRDPEFQDNPDLPLRFAAEGEEKRPTLWLRMSRLMEVVIFLLLILAVVKLFGPEKDRRNELQSEIQRLSQIEKEREEKVRRLRQEHRLLKTDREYLEMVARDRLDLQAEGEYIIRINREEGGQD